MAAKRRLDEQLAFIEVQVARVRAIIGAIRWWSPD
jgi:hypothetical protein